MSKYATLLSADFKSIRRDPMLYILFLSPAATILLLRFAVPHITRLLNDTLAFDLSPHHHFIVTFLALMMAMLSGTVFSFITLDERDENIITALSATPLTNRGYILYRIAVTLGSSLVLHSVVLFLNGLVDIPLGRILLTAAVASFNGGLFLLFIASAADNKIEGLALTKIGGLFFFAPVAAYLIPSSILHVPFAFLPPFWIVPVMYARGSSLIFALLGFVGVTLFWYIMLLKWFNKRTF